MIKDYICAFVGVLLK